MAATASLSGSAFAEPFATLVTRYQLSPPRWPAGLAVKLAVIADLHACEPWMGRERIRRIVGHANALEPDCVLLLGDYVAGKGMMRYADPIPEKDWARELGRLRPRGRAKPQPRRFGRPRVQWRARALRCAA